jgi:hypothetical protein
VNFLALFIFELQGFRRAATMRVLFPPPEMSKGDPSVLTVIISATLLVK